MASEVRGRPLASSCKYEVCELTTGICSLTAQGLQRADPGCAPGGNPARTNCHYQQQNRDDSHRKGIVRRNAEELALDELTCQERTPEADCQTGQHRN